MRVNFHEIVASAVTLPPRERSEFMLQLREFAADYAEMDAGDWLRKYSITKPMVGDPKTQLMQDLKSAGKL